MEINEIKIFANQVRKLTLKMVFNAKASHIGGAYSMTDILAVLYTKILNIDPQNPDFDQRDRFLLSKGHACSSFYATLAIRGFFPQEELEETYAKDGSKYLSHTSHYIKGVEVSAGSLGHALSMACGIAISSKTKKEKWNTFCLLSDGELNEGSNWEVFLLAPKLRLDNFIVVIDYNKIQSLGFVKDIIDLEPLAEKFSCFGWEVYEIDGHDYTELINTFSKATNNKNGVPKIIIANTIKGKGVDFMENKVLWHYKSPDINEYNDALLKLNTI